MKKKAIIISLSGFYLTKKEKKLFKYYLPWGIILFKRNIKDFNQLKKLILSIKRITKDNKFPVLIDEEGGAISRLTDLISNKNFSQRYFAQIYEINQKIGIGIYKIYINEICTILRAFGININTVPVLDRLSKNTHPFLKDRVYSEKIKTIIDLSKLCIDTYKKNKISTVIKHIPGHGLAKSDSHKRLPIVNKNINYLLNNDFKCFQNSPNWTFGRKRCSIRAMRRRSGWSTRLRT